MPSFRYVELERAHIGPLWTTGPSWSGIADAGKGAAGFR